jgi:hypothetical protein
MGFLIEPLAITLPVGAFNGSSIVDARLKPIEQHLIAPAVGAAQPRRARCLRRRYLAVQQRALVQRATPPANTSRTRSWRSRRTRPSSQTSPRI